MTDAAVILIYYLQQDYDLLDGHTDPTRIVPHWFYNLNEQKKFNVPRPEYVGPRTPKVMERIVCWHKDPCFDLSDPPIEEDFNDVEIEGLKYYERDVKQWEVEKYHFELSQQFTLLRKWIYWLSQFTHMEFNDNQVMAFAGLVPDDDNLPY